jgi:AAA domain-containing protein
VRLRRLEVQDFRGIREAKIKFATTGLTVLHGPNELGKSTLVEAIHAALFLQTTSQAGNEHVTWESSTPACVTLIFEHDGKLWRVEKRFRYSRHATLARSDNVDVEHFHQVAEGNHVESKLRELLAWGIAPPGGRGAAPKAESFLLTALLGRQGEVQKIFDASLDKDKDDTGKSLVTQAMGALDKDPLVSHILERLGTRVEAVFDSQGRLRTAADSPLVKLQQYLRTQEVLLGALQEDDRKGKLIQAEVVRLQDGRHRLLGELQSAEANWEAAKAQAERASMKAKQQVEIDDVRRQLGEVDRLTTELTSLDGQSAAASSSLAILKDAESAAAAALEATRSRLQEAAEAVARENEAAEHSGRLKEATRAQRRAELETRKTTAEARLKDVTAAEQAMSEAALLERQFSEASEARNSAFDAVAPAERAFEHATVRTALEELIEREKSVTRAAEHLADAQQREQAARAQLHATAAALAEAEGRRDRREAESNSDEIKNSESDLLLLQAVDAHIVIKALRAEMLVLEDTAVRARTLRAGAQTRRSDASGIDQRVASRVLPTKEQIAAWRTLEEEMKASPHPTSAAPSSPLMPVVLTFVGALVLVATAAHLGLGWPLLTAALAGLVAAAIVGGVAWFGLQGRVRAQSEEYEHRTRRRDRWTQEVEPSLRAAGLAKLADYESAVGDVQREKADAQRLRDQADQDDHDAGEAERSAASLESRREALARLEREASTADAVAVSTRAAIFDGDANKVRLRVMEVQQAVESTRGRLRKDADAVVNLAIDQRFSRQTEYDAAAKDVTAAETTLSLARQQSDSEAITRLRVRLEEIGEVATPKGTVAEASKALEEAKTHHTTASTKADGLRARLDEMRPGVERLVSMFGGDLTIARQEVQRSLEEIATELAGVDAPPAAGSAAVALEGARNRHETLARQFASDKATLESTTKNRSNAERALTALETDAAALRGQVTAINRSALESRLQTVASDPVFQIPDGPPLDPGAAQATFEGLQQQLERCTNDLNHGRGQLHLIAGHVGSERLAQQQEAVSHAHAEVRGCEQAERAALRLLREIQTIEAERATHLGRALAGPITETFRALTGGRYGPISVAPDLKTEHIEAHGAARQLEHLSVGTREQLATLLRLAIAGYLRTAIVLDDQLVHSDHERLAWFSERLRASASERDHQVIVFTCRPGDYLHGDAIDDGVTSVNLAALVSR